jgi:DNA-binding NarL/FixJ family response regulator
VDLELPRINGRELCLYLRGTGRRCALLVVSGRAQKPELQLLHQLGVRHVIHKGSGIVERFTRALLELTRHVSLVRPPAP